MICKEMKVIGFQGGAGSKKVGGWGVEAAKAIVFPNKLCRIIKPGLTCEQLDKLNTEKLKEGEVVRMGQ